MNVDGQGTAVSPPYTPRTYYGPSKPHTSSLTPEMTYNFHIVNTKKEESMFEINVVQVKDGFVGQVLHQIQGRLGREIVWESEPFKDSNSKKKNALTGYAKARNAAEAAIKSGVARLFEEE